MSFFYKFAFDNNEKMETDSIIYNKSIIEFVTVAKEFMGLLEKGRDMQRDDFIANGLKILPLLYLKTDLLPKIEEPENTNIERFVDENQYAFVQNSVAIILEDDDQYIEVQDMSVDRSLDFLNVSISELFADIYQDLGDVIGAYRLLDENLILPSLYICKKNFESFWGIRIIILMENLHKIKYFEDENSI